MNCVISQGFPGEETGIWDGSWKDGELNGLPVTSMFILEELMRWWPHPLKMCSYITGLECWNSDHSLVEVDEPYGQLFRGCLVPVDGVAFPQSYNWLILLVMSAFAQSPFQVEWVIVVVIFYYFHFQVGRLVGLDVYLDGKKPRKKDHQVFNELQWKVQRLNRCELVQALRAGQGPVCCELMFNSLGFRFNKANCFQKKKKKRLISSSTEFKCMCQRLQQGWDIPQHPAAPSSRTVSTSDIWLVLNKDPSVWISEAWNPAQWLEIGCSGTTQKKKNPTVATPQTKPGTLSRGKWRLSWQQHSGLLWWEEWFGGHTQDERPGKLKSNFDWSAHFP